MTGRQERVVDLGREFKNLIWINLYICGRRLQGSGEADFGDHQLLDASRQQQVYIKGAYAGQGTPYVQRKHHIDDVADARGG